MAELTTQEKILKERDRCAIDIPYYASGHLRIRPKTGGLIPLKLKKSQKYYHDRCEEQKARTGMVRVLCLKGRQQGISTYIEGRGYHTVTHRIGWSAFILTHEDKATKNLFGMAKRYHDNMNKLLRPGTGASNTSELTFPKIDGRYEVATAGTKEVGRSQTTQFFHGSEVAFWPNAEEHAKGAIQTVPLEPNTEIHLESTANGIGNWFHQQWYLAKRGLSRYIAVFIPWFWEDEYSTPDKDMPEDFIPTTFQDELYGNEMLIRQLYDLTNNQLEWRRKKIIELGSLQSFYQEYPCTDDEAFTFSGNTFFQKTKLADMKRNIKPPIARGRLEQVNKIVRFIPDEEGYLEIWEHPLKNADYGEGVDVSEGNDDGDQNSLNILKRGDRREQVARAAPQKINPDEVGRVSVLLALYYRDGTPLGIERNNMGIAAVLAAEQTEYEYIYREVKHDAHDQEEAESGKYGWVTNVATRNVGLSALRAAVRDDVLIIRSEETLSQFGTFVRDKKGKPQAISGCLDDEVMSLMIANQMIERTEPERPDEDFDGLTDESGGGYGSGDSNFGGSEDHGWMGI